VTSALTLYLTKKFLMVLHFDAQNLTSLPFLFTVFCLGCKTISRRAARRLIVLHPKQNTESELKWRTCFGTMPSGFSFSSGKGLTVYSDNVPVETDAQMFASSFQTVLKV
jgi:hypothetical protein